VGGLPDIEGVALLREPVRRALYLLVRRAGHPVGREEAAEAVGISRSLAAFHLDRLADAGLLAVEYRRLTGRTGRGAGRPAKLYGPGTRRVRVSLPATRYELAGELLIRALERKRPGETAEEAARRSARTEGRRMATGLDPGSDAWAPMARMRAALEELGFEPEGGNDLVLRNCPFHELMERHPGPVCAMNRGFLSGLAGELAGGRVVAEPWDAPGYCCVRVRRR
jgi:predicted ArsR family transcriptional regulator